MIVVTGGAGFIGSAMIWQLNQAGYQNIISIDDLGTGSKWKNLVKRQFAFNVRIATGLKWLKKHADQIEAVFHMGACSATTENDADYLMDNNVHYSRKIWKLCAKQKIPLIYASSAATYGSREEGFSDDHQSNHELRPINQYGWSKHVFDRWALSQKTAPDRWFGLKFFNVYGPNEYHKGAQASVGFHASKQIAESGTLKLFKSHRQEFSDGGQMRDFVYVKDITKIMLHLWQETKAESGIYNLGTGVAASFSSLGEACFTASGLPAKIKWIDMPEALRNQYQYFTQAELAKLREKAHYHSPLTALDAGIQDYYQNYLLTADPYL